MEAVLDADSLAGCAPCALWVLHRLALAFLAVLIGEQMLDLPLLRMGDQSGQKLDRFGIRWHRLGALRLGRFGVQPDAAINEVDLLHLQAEDLPLSESHEPGQHDPIGEVLGCGGHDRLEVVIGDGPGQMLGLGQLGHLRHLGQERATGAVLQAVDDGQGLAERHEISVDCRVGARPPVFRRGVAGGLLFRGAGLGTAAVDHHRLGARPGNVLPDSLFSEVGDRCVGTEVCSQIGDIHLFVGPVL
nr:hypothetical protein [Azospirillum brasilense]